MRFIFRLLFWRQGDRKDLEWFSSWKKGDEWDPEILCNDFYSSFASWPRDISIGVAPGKLEFDILGEDRSTVGVGCTWEGALEGAPAGWPTHPPTPGQGLILLNERFWESAGSHVNGG